MKKNKKTEESKTVKNYDTETIEPKSLKDYDTEILEPIEEVIIEEAVSELDKIKKLNADLSDKFQRSLAEFDNFRKRTMKEKSHMYNDGVKDTVEKLLPTIDNFERALKSIENKEQDIYKGIDMIYRQLHGTLNEIGVEEIKSVGEKFDTTFHFAVAHIEDEKYGENEVVEELQKGYKYKDKVIRCSMVKVAN